MTTSDPALLKRCAIALAALAVYGTGAAWAVRQQAASYRASLRPAPAESPPPVVESRPAASEPTPPRPAPAPNPPSIPQETAIAEAPPAPRPSTEAARPKPPKPAPSEAKSAPKAPPAPTVDPIWNDPGVTKVYDLDRMTTADEVRLGEAMNRLILALHPRVRVRPEDRQAGAGGSEDRAFLAARPILERRQRKEITYQFFVLDSPEPVIFSTPGGFLYLTEGLMRWFGEDEDYALQFFLAHEIAHVDNRHALECLRVPELKEAVKKVGTAELLYREILPRAYFDGHELAADRWALRCLTEMGLGRLEKLAALRKLDNYAKANDFLRGRIPPDPKDPDRSLLENHLRAHISVARRLDEAKAIVDGK